MFQRDGIKISLRILLGITISIYSYSCGVTRHIPEDKLLLQKVTITNDKDDPKDQLVPRYELERYVRQSPNKRLFGFNFYIWVYNMANPEKENWWNNLKRKVGEKPIYLDVAQTQRSQENINLYLDSRGFYASKVDYTIDTIAERRRACVTYHPHQGKAYVINELKYTLRDSSLSEYIAPDTVKSLIHRGDIFNSDLLNAERERIASNLRDRGYFDFTVNNISFQADTLIGNHRVDLDMIIKRELSGYNSRGVAEYKNNTRYRIGEVNIIPDFNADMIINSSEYMQSIDSLNHDGLNIFYPKDGTPNVRPRVLRQMVPLMPKTLYNASTIEQTYKNLMSLGYFKSARITFEHMTPDSLQIDTLARPSDQYLKSYILCTPALKQSYDIQLEGSTTSSFYGVYGTVGYQNRNIFRGAEAWNIDFTVGYEHMKARDALKKRATEIGISTGLDFPRFLLPTNKHFINTVQPKTEVELSINMQDRPYYNRTLSSASLSYSWRNKGNSSFLIRPVDINLIDMNYIDEEYFNDLENDYLRNSYETQLIAGLNLGYVYNNQLKKLNGNSTTLRVNFETAGNLINGGNKLFGSPLHDGGYYKILGIRYAQYVRGDFNISRKFNTGSRTAIAARILAGAGSAYGNSKSIPFDRLFYSGGSNSMRGWTPRTLGPGSSAEPEDKIYPSQLGDMKLEANVEFRFPIWGSIFGATFLDAGNVWYLKDSEGVYEESGAQFDIGTFYKQLGFNTGVGVRLDIQFAVLRLDWGVQLHNPNKPFGEKWVIKNFKWSNSALNFGVGYPF